MPFQTVGVIFLDAPSPDSGHNDLLEAVASVGYEVESFTSGFGAIQDVIRDKDAVLLVGADSDLMEVLGGNANKSDVGDYIMLRTYILGGQIDNRETLIAHLVHLRQPIKYTKIFTFLDNKNGEIGRLTRSVKFKDAELQINSNSELQVSSTKIETINNIHKHLVSKFKSKLSFVEYLDPMHERLFASSKPHILEAIAHVEKCFDMFGADNVFISFNGGKDCTVLLHLMLAVLKRSYIQYRKPVFCMYVKSKRPFDEINKFIDDMQCFYELEVVTIDSEIKEALSRILAERPNLKACLMGTRRTDPFSQNLQPFKMTDNGWPEVMRVSPILDWDYGDVWDYLLDFKVPYCGLYDQGFTSLGNVDNTDRNPELLHGGAYLPAYKLLDGTKERSGRRK